MKTLQYILFLWILINQGIYFQYLNAQEAIIPQNEYATIRDEMIDDIKRVIRRHKIKGLSIALTTNEKILWAEGFGLADKDNSIPATAKTIYRVGSISKLFTALAVMQLAEQEKLCIDSGIQCYIPGFKIKKKTACQNRITPRNVLMHHSGLSCDYVKGFSSRKGNDFRKLPILLQDEYAAYPPEKIYSYSNTGYALLGIVVENVSNQDFYSYTKQNIFNKLDMPYSMFENPALPRNELLQDSLLNLFSKGYIGRKAKEDINFRDVSAGMMATNVLDLSRFMQMVLSDGKYGNTQVLQPETLKEMLTPQNKNIALDLDLQTGLGWFLKNDTSLQSGKTAYHGGATYTFHALLHTFIDHQFGIVVLTNSYGGNLITSYLTMEIYKKAVEALHAIELKSKYEHVELLKNITTDYSEYTGYYALQNNLMHLQKAKHGKLIGKVGRTRIEMFPNTVDEFTLRVKLLRFIPFRVNDYFEFQNIENYRVITNDDEVIFAEKIVKPVYSEIWHERKGDYKSINKDDDYIYTIDKAEIYSIDGFLMIDIQSKKLGTNTRILNPLDENKVTTFGLGRGLGETYYFTKNNDGQEILHISGYQLIKK